MEEHIHKNIKETKERTVKGHVVKTSKLNNKSHCPNCGIKLDAASSMKGHIPEEGDVSICIECAEILEYDDKLMLNKISKEKFEILPDSTIKQLRYYQKVIFEKNENRRRRRRMNK